MPADVVVVGYKAPPAASAGPAMFSATARPAQPYGHLSLHVQQQAKAHAQHRFNRHTTQQQQPQRQASLGPPNSRSVAARVAWEHEQEAAARAVQHRQVTTHPAMQPDVVQPPQQQHQAPPLQLPQQQQQTMDMQQQPLAKYSVPWLLQRIDMEKYAPVFKLHEVDNLVTLCALTKEDMVRILGLPLGAAVKIGKAIEYIAETKPAA
jgi:hypothetical protein